MQAAMGRHRSGNQLINCVVAGHTIIPCYTSSSCYWGVLLAVAPGCYTQCLRRLVSNLLWYWLSFEWWYLPLSWDNTKWEMAPSQATLPSVPGINCVTSRDHGRRKMQLPASQHGRGYVEHGPDKGQSSHVPFDEFMCFCYQVCLRFGLSLG